MSAARFSCRGRHFSPVLCASGASWRAWLCELGALVEPSGRHFESVAKWSYHFPKACSDTGLLKAYALGAAWADDEGGDSAGVGAEKGWGGVGVVDLYTVHRIVCD